MMEFEKIYQGKDLCMQFISFSSSDEEK